MFFKLFIVLSKKYLIFTFHRNTRPLQLELPWESLVYHGAHSPGISISYDRYCHADNVEVDHAYLKRIENEKSYHEATATARGARVPMNLLFSIEKIVPEDLKNADNPTHIPVYL